MHYDIWMTGNEQRAKRCNTKNKQEVCRSLFSSNFFILCRLICLHLFSHKVIKHRNAGKEKTIYPHDSLQSQQLSFVMQGNEAAAESLRRAAYNLGGVICQYQYSSKWDQAERELRNIANGVREEEWQQQRRGLRI